jgi:ubiquinone/menaquinone biosynthesis C-methylase UbiE
LKAVTKFKENDQIFFMESHYEIACRERWNKIYREGRFKKSVDKNFPQIVEILKEYEIKKVLELGCGAGRHVVYLAKMGFEVYGIDIAKYGIKIARKWLREENLKAKLKVGDIYKKLPYKDNFFDAIICIRTLNHGKIEWIRRAIKEMYRILKPNGYVFVTVHKHRGKKHIPKEKLYGIKWIAPRTYIILGGPEKGIPHYRFNKKILISEFKKVGFKILDFWTDSKGYYCMLCQKELNAKLN